MNTNNNEKFLPIGTVVLLKGGTKKTMITGFCSVAAEDRSKMYDYTGCVYPEGFLDFNQVCLFDHEQIDQVFHYGYVDQEETDFKKELTEIASKFSNEEDFSKSLIDEVIDEEDDDINDKILPIILENDDNEEKTDILPSIEIPIKDDEEIEQLEYL